MVFPGCEGFKANQFRPNFCMNCSHTASDHSKEAIEDLLRSYTTDVKLDYEGSSRLSEISSLGAEDEDTSDWTVQVELGVAPARSAPVDAAKTVTSTPSSDVAAASSSPTAGNTTSPRTSSGAPPSIPARRSVPSIPVSDAAEAPPSATRPPGVCPVCNGPTENFTVRDVALPCVRCPKPLTPPSRRRVVGGAPGNAAQPARAAIPSFDKPGSTVRPPGKPSPASTSDKASPIPEKPLIKATKGFSIEWGLVQTPVQQKNQIVDDDRYVDPMLECCCSCSLC